MTLRALAASLTTAVALAAMPAPAGALTFSFSQIAGDSLTAAQSTAFQTAADLWSATLSDAITVSVQIGFKALPTNVLGSTSPTIIFSTGNAFKTAITADAKDLTDTQAVASLATSTQSVIALSSADGKALGYTVPSGITNDGTIEFSNSFTFSTARNPDGTIPAGTYDLIGIAEHEIGHILGFVSSVDGFGAGSQTVLDQFRYGQPGIRRTALGADAYFSVDGGLTNLGNFATGVGNQASHWLVGSSGLMAPEVGAGQAQNLTAQDIQAFDAIGYDLVAVPEPWSIAILAVGAMAGVGVRRRA